MELARSIACAIALSEAFFVAASALAMTRAALRASRPTLCM
jgi:hypothetical protein